MTTRPPISTLTDTLFPYTTLVRSEVTLSNRGRENEAFQAGKTRRQLQLTIRFFLDIGFQHDAVRGRARFLFNFQFFLKITQRLDAICRPLDLKAVERIAFVQAEFAADHLVLRQSVSVDVDTFDIDEGGKIGRAHV